SWPCPISWTTTACNSPPSLPAAQSKRARSLNGPVCLRKPGALPAVFLAHGRSLLALQLGLLGLQGVDLALHGAEFLAQLLLLLRQCRGLLARLFLAGGHLLFLLAAQGLIGLQRGQLAAALGQQPFRPRVFGLQLDALDVDF